MKNMLIKGGSGTGKTITARAIAYYIGHEGQEIRDVYKNDFWLDLVAIENFAQSEFRELNDWSQEFYEQADECCRFITENVITADTVPLLMKLLMTIYICV